MGKRFSHNEKGLYTSAEAVAFIGCSCEERRNENSAYAAIVFSGSYLKTMTKSITSHRTYPEIIALYDAVNIVLDYCRKKGVGSVDIIYDSEKMLISKLSDVPEDTPWLCREDVSKGTLRQQYGNMDVRLYKVDAYEVERIKLVSALRWRKDTQWLKQLMTGSLYLVLAEELANAVRKGENFVRDVEHWIETLGDYKEIVVCAVRDDMNGEDEKFDDDCCDWGEIDEELPIDEDGGSMRAESENTERGAKTIMSRKGRNSGERTILDLILAYAESIKKSKMTLFHLLYGYACVCLTDEKDICQELQEGEGAYTKISYVKNRLLKLFSSETVLMDPYKLKIMIPKYIDDLEKDATSAKEYEEVVDTINKWRNQSLFSDDVITYSVLHRILTDSQNFNVGNPNMVYLKQNRDFALGKSKEVETEKPMENLETVAKKSTELYEVLTQKIFGQDMAIQKFVQGYINSRMAGQSRKDKPAASYLFAGPPGVGKTYLARVSSEVLGIPVKIFDMSEYMDEHSANGLVGFEKTWKASTPGALTSYVDNNPVSIILLDEIEKAHITVQMLFLQILEGARLYDKYYEKYVSFENTIVIFTTNCGKSLYEYNEDTDLSALPETEVLESLREDMAFPNELCSRFAAGSIIVFNHLKTHFLLDIIRSKMEAAIEEISKRYQLTISYDKLLPELFLFHAGNAVDARVASIQSAEMIKNHMISFVKSEVEKSDSFAVKKISLDIKFDKENQDVYSLFVAKEESSVLVLSDSVKFQFQHPRIKVLVAENEDEMVRCIRENTISLILIDLAYKTDDDQAGVTNALGVESVGRKCLDVVREKAPQLPVYIIDSEFYRTEDKKAIVNYGAGGFFATGQNEKECIRNLQELIVGLHIKKKLKQLGQKGQRVEYRTRYMATDGCGVIEFYHLSLKTFGMDDAALRRKAAQSKVFEFERPTLRFDDIVGAKQAKQNFRHFINYIQNIDKYVLEGAETPKGILLYGPPGTGKTSLAKALAGECEALFLSTTGANIRNSENSVQEIKDLFRIAYINAPAILFIDEIDVIAKERKGYDTGTELLVNTLLTEMEGFHDKDPFKPVFVVAATNYDVTHHADRPNEIVIDPALVRRFDNPVYVGLPSRDERKQYIQTLLDKKRYSDRISEVAIDYVAEHTGGKSLAFLRRAISNMTNEAIDAGKEINDDLLTDTLETQLYGEKRENDEAYRLSVARHEAGHAYVSWKTGREPKFITIVSRGHFGGYVSYGDGEDIHNLTRQDYLNYICQALAGRAAEQVYYGEDGINTGASSDLEQATKYAIRMICYLGMGDLGLVSINPEYVLDSPKGAEVLEEANRILREQMERAANYIKEGQRAIDRVTDVLMDKSYIQGENLIAILEEGEQLGASHKDNTTKKHKWYVVINGKKPGIYTTWAECAEQVKGYSNAVYRSYETENAAREAFQSSRIGVKNIRDKKFLYHLVKLSDMEHIIRNGVRPDKQIEGKTYICFDFHAYAPEAVETQRMNPEDTYVYLCISRERAFRLGYRILMENLKERSVKVYDYEEGYSKIDWGELENPEDEKNQKTSISCVSETMLSYDQIEYVYTPDQESVIIIKDLCRKIEDVKEDSVVVGVNKRMFI